MSDFAAALNKKITHALDSRPTTVRAKVVNNENGDAKGTCTVEFPNPTGPGYVRLSGVLLPNQNFFLGPSIQAETRVVLAFNNGVMSQPTIVHIGTVDDAKDPQNQDKTERAAASPVQAQLLRPKVPPKVLTDSVKKNYLP